MNMIHTEISRPFKKIGIFDSGIGGLTILKPLLDHYAVECIYVADTHYMPYGTKSPEAVTQLSARIVKFLLQHNVDAIIIACHTISAVSLQSLQAQFPHIKFFGMIEPVTRKVLHNPRTQRIGILATSNSIMSHAHKKALQAHNPSLYIVEQACHSLAERIEHHTDDHLLIDATLDEYLQPLLQADLDVIMLGCTHYSIIKDRIKQKIGTLPLICADDEISSALKSWLVPKNNVQSTVTVIVTGDLAAFKEQAVKLFTTYPIMYRKESL